MKMYVGTDWVDASESIEVINPFDGSVVDTVPKATAADVDRAVTAAMRGAKVMAALTGYERSEILRRAGDLILERVDELAPVITREQGKIIGEARVEATRAAEILYLSAEEAKRLNSEVVPLEGGPGVRGKIGFTLRVPCGVVAAISPFNFPLHLVCHKAGPALAGGNAVIIKPATDTPLSALKLVDILLEAGTPPEAVQCLTGAGSDIGDVLVSDPRVRKITFTGSRDVGEHICKTAGLKKVTMELGSNSPVIIMDDADMEKVSSALVQTTFANAGQVCISTQRIFADGKIYSDFIDSFGDTVSKINYGDPFDENVMMGPLVRESDAERVASWIDQAVTDGARWLRAASATADSSKPRSWPTSTRDASVLRRAVRSRRRRFESQQYRRGARPRQRLALRAERRDIYAGHRPRDEVRPADGRRKHTHQLGLAMASRPDALRRHQGKRHGQRRSALRGQGNDRRKAGRPAPRLELSQ